MSNKKVIIKETPPKKSGHGLSALFAIEKDNYVGKIMRIEGELAADAKLAAEIAVFTDTIQELPKGDREDYFDREHVRLAAAYRLHGPYRKVLWAMMQGIKPDYDLIVEATVRDEDDDYFYLRINNNITTEDMSQLYTKILGFIDTTKNKPSNIINPRDNWDEAILGLRSQGVSLKEIGDQFGKTEAEISIRLNRLEKKKMRFKKP